ncbi:MAG: sulfatase [Verrucomicrobiota bacterium]|nr:sulfatase [Verrucomicrobiota bacterium]
MTALTASRTHAFFALVTLLILATGGRGAESRPNILWITAEDMSPNLGAYGDAYARTPHLDAFARESVRYTRAFATAPVCSPARSALITGLYATSLGTQRLRSQFPVPAEFRAFPAWLREAGYHCSNNVKTDYNCRGENDVVRDAWDESSPQAHWRKRRPGQPFFAVFNSMSTHQSRTGVLPPKEFEKQIGSRLKAEERHDPAQAPLPPFYPDTPDARRAWARYHDCISALDKDAGELLQQLKADGLEDDTLVFFFSDHGMGMPRGKRCLFDSGLRVPLLIRFPQKFAHLAPAPAGGATERLVSFVDFAPTVLSLAGVPAPAHLQGAAFLGTAAGHAREFVFGARDRVDEAFDLSRSVRDGRWLYIRNFMPHLSWLQPERYSDGSEFRRALKRFALEAKLDRAQFGYAAPHKPREELYDTQGDPHQLHNLADDPAHRATLEKLRRVLREWMVTSRDVGFLTEPQVWERIGRDSTPFELARDARRYPLSRLLEAADLVGVPEAVEQQAALLTDPHDGVRYWAAVGLRAAGAGATAAREGLRKALEDESSSVRIEVAAALMSLAAEPRALRVLEQELASTNADAALHAARALELLGEKARPSLPGMRAALERARADEQGNDILMFVRFSLEAAVEQLEATASSGQHN